MCNGHADTCDIQDSENPTKLKCRCQHNTCGPQCTSCCSGYEQKAWRIAKSWEPPFVCERKFVNNVLKKLVTRLPNFPDRMIRYGSFFLNISSKKI